MESRAVLMCTIEWRENPPQTPPLGAGGQLRPQMGGGNPGCARLGIINFKTCTFELVPTIKTFIGWPTLLPPQLRAIFYAYTFDIPFMKFLH